MQESERPKATLDDLLAELKAQKGISKNFRDRLKAVKEWSSTGYMWAEVDYET